MGGQVLEHEAKTIYNQGLSFGFESGRAEGFTAGRINALMDLVNIGLLSVDDAAKTAGLSKSEFEKKCKKIKNS